MVTLETKHKVEAAVRGKNGEQFDEIYLHPGIYVVPEYNTGFERGRRIWSCMLEIDGVKYNIYLG